MNEFIPNGDHWCPLFIIFLWSLILTLVSFWSPFFTSTNMFHRTSTLFIFAHSNALKPTVCRITLQGTVIERVAKCVIAYYVIEYQRTIKISCMSLTSTQKLRASVLFLLWHISRSVKSYQMCHWTFCSRISMVAACKRKSWRGEQWCGHLCIYISESIQSKNYYWKITIGVSESTSQPRAS